MIDREELESRLKNWASEYGGGRYPNVGWQGRNLLQTLIEHEGFVPSSRGFIPIPTRSKADEVESIVMSMPRLDMERQAKVLRCDYFAPALPITARLDIMSKAGFKLSRASYYDILSQAKAFVMGALCNRELS